jgi:hypothetical protein
MSLFMSYALVWVHSYCQVLSGIKIPGYPTDGKIRYPARSLKPHHRGPSKTDSPNALTACQSLEARTINSIPPEPCGKVSGEIGTSGSIFPPRPSPCDVIKAPDPLNSLLPRLRDTWNPQARRGATGDPNHGTRSHGRDGHDRAQSTGAWEPRPDPT